MELDLATLEKEPRERETLARAFRTVRTVKGSAGFLGFTKLQAVRHAAESRRRRLRAGKLVFHPDIATALRAVVDASRRMLASVEAARAGEAGKGVAVVANAAKELARQTAKAAEDVSAWIEAIPTDTKGAVEAIGPIGKIINPINGIQNTVASAIDG